MNDDRVCGWWQRGDELAITACGLKLGTDDPLRAATVWGNSGVEITCEECRKTLRAAGIRVELPCRDNG